MLRKLLCSLLFSALTLGAAELTGKWSGSFNITTTDRFGKESSTARSSLLRFRWMTVGF